MSIDRIIKANKSIKFLLLCAQFVLFTVNKAVLAEWELF